MVPLQHQRQWIHARLSAISRRAPSGAPPPERPRTDDVTCMRRWLGKVEGLQVSLAGAKDKIAQIVSTLQRKSSGTDLGDVWASAGATRRGSLSSRPVRMDDPSLRRAAVAGSDAGVCSIYPRSRTWAETEAARPTAHVRLVCWLSEAGVTDGGGETGESDHPRAGIARHGQVYG